MFSRVEEERLQYIRSSRSFQLRQLEEQREEAFILDPDLELQRSDTVTLPSSFIGSRAWASDQVADSMALCREYGKPSLFITVTTNVRWPEIVSQLSPGQSASDIPIIVCRCFRERLRLCLQFIRKMFGSLVYLVRVTEFQKGGLPHAHIALKVCYIYLNERSYFQFLTF